MNESASNEYQKHLKRAIGIPADMDFETAPILVGHGLTKREYFSGLAMQSWITKCEAFTYQDIATRSIDMADELIKQLDKDNHEARTTEGK